MIREETDKPMNRLYDVDLLEGQGNQGTWILLPPQLLGYIYDSEDSNHVLMNIS